MREKMIKLLEQAKYCSIEELANYIVAAGLIIPLRCKECKHRYLNEHGEPCCDIWVHGRDTVVRDYDFCSYGERRINV